MEGFYEKINAFLGALFVVATAQAKEIVVAPVAVEEVVTEQPVVEEIVAEPVAEVVTVPKTFKPSGWMNLEYRAYGKTEGEGDSVNSHTGESDSWNPGWNNYSRLETTFGVHMTENFSLEGRIRDYNNIEGNSGVVKGNDGRYSGKRNASGTDRTETRLRFYYRHTDYFTSRFEYKNLLSDAQLLEYRAQFTVFHDENGLLSNLVLAPKVNGLIPKDNGGDYDTGLGMDIEYAGNLPLGFTWDGTIYLEQRFYGNDIQTDAIGKYTNKGQTYATGLKGKKDKEFVASWELYLYNTLNIYKTDRTLLDLYFEGGYDPYMLGQYDRYTKDDYDQLQGAYKISEDHSKSYSLYAQFALQGQYKITESFALNGGIGAEYRNWGDIDQATAKNWRWQPFAYVGMKTTF